MDRIVELYKLAIDKIADVYGYNTAIADMKRGELEHLQYAYEKDLPAWHQKVKEFIDTLEVA